MQFIWVRLTQVGVPASVTGKKKEKKKRKKERRRKARGESYAYTGRKAKS